MFSTEKKLSAIPYIFGVLVIFVAVYAQYFIDIGTLGAFLLVYGLPILVVSLIFGRPILKRALKNSGTATKYGLGLFGAFTILSIFISIVVILVLIVFDPQIINVLSRPNPVLDISSNEAWVMVAISLLIIGPAEEYLFRGFMFGGLISVTKGRYWFGMAILSSALFALVHAYYAVTYGVASVISFLTLFFFGLAMAITYYWSKGNLIVPILIHGIYDATGFAGVALDSTEIGLALRGAFIIIGAVFAAIYLPKKLSKSKKSEEKANSNNTSPQLQTSEQIE